MKHDKQKRSFAKTITWRICATLTTIILVWVFIGELSVALSVGFVEMIVKMFVYYFHERAWDKFGWGINEFS
ncbi:DUF2061 domain-containing protein [Candidatus Pacearchaeota archaeon]|nr:DUF2061 domain-containing protein [Candidatus Pacearchaeota archaeon]MBD3282686.1 DUF2061 domain-containing protein [Candidatus Pacearchaeota archaeon]